MDELSKPQTNAIATTGLNEPPAANLSEANVRLRAENRQLREQQELASAQIQRLSIECQQLREQLERISDVTRINRHPL